MLDVMSHFFFVVCVCGSLIPWHKISISLGLSSLILSKLKFQYWGAHLMLWKVDELIFGFYFFVSYVVCVMVFAQFNVEHLFDLKKKLRKSNVHSVIYSQFA